MADEYTFIIDACSQVTGMAFPAKSCTAANAGQYKVSDDE